MPSGRGAGWYSPAVSALAPLLEVQDVDLARDRLVERRRDLPERASLEQGRTRAADLDGTHAEIVARREALSRAEHGLGAEVAALAAKAKEVEDRLYSGSIRAPKELAAQQQELRLLRERQSQLEVQELELLEQIEDAEGEMAANRAARAEADREIESLAAAIRAAEEQIDAELARLESQRDARLPSLPAAVRAEYERLRQRERLRGRAAAALADGVCGGCRVKLPVLEYSKMKAQPEDALICCVACGRLLVR